MDTNNNELIVTKVRAYVKNQLEKESTGHDYWHIERVYNLSIRLGQEENANLFIVKLAALLHDISDHKFNDGNSKIGADLAKKILTDYGCSDDVINAVYSIIMTISFKGGTVDSTQDTIEGKVVQDADRLDALGAVGIARTFAYGGKKGREIYNPFVKPVKHTDFNTYKKSTTPTINHFYEKLLLLEELMNTNTGRIIARERTQFMKDYLKQFYKEWDGKDI